MARAKLIHLLVMAVLICTAMPIFDVYAQTSNIDLSFRFSSAVDWQENGYRLAISSRGDKHIYILSDTLQELAVLDTGILDADDLSWSIDGHQLAASVAGGLSGDLIQIWNTDENVTPFALSHSLSTVALTGLLRWSPDGTILGKRREAVLASASNNGIEIWNTDSGQKIKALDSESALLDLAWRPDGTQIAAVSGLGILRVWDVATGSLLLEKKDSGFYWSIAWQPTGNTLAAYNIQNQTFEFWDVSQQQVMFTRHGSGQTVQDEEHLVWATGGFASFDRQNRIKIWDIQTGDIIDTIQTSGRIELLGWSPSGTQLFYAATTQGGIQDALKIVPAPVVTSTPPETPTATVTPSADPNSHLHTQHYPDTYAASCHQQ